MKRVLTVGFIAMCGVAHAQSLPPVPGVPTYDNFAQIVQVQSNAYCNKAILKNGHTWAIAPGDINAEGRWQMILTLFTAKTPSVAMATSSDPYYSGIKIGISPVTYCADPDDKTVTAFPNPAAIYSQ